MPGDRPASTPPTLLVTLALALAAASLGACDGGPPTGGNLCAPLEIRVSAGTEPTFSWTPGDCAPSYLWVDTLPPGTNHLWTAPGPARSGLRYAGPPLVAGRRYRVEMGSYTAFGTGGSAEFTP